MLDKTDCKNDEKKHEIPNIYQSNRVSAVFVVVPSVETELSEQINDRINTIFQQNDKRYGHRCLILLFLFRIIELKLKRKEDKKKKPNDSRHKKKKKTNETVHKIYIQHIHGI